MPDILCERKFELDLLMLKLTVWAYLEKMDTDLGGFFLFSVFCVSNTTGNILPSELWRLVEL